MENPWRTLIKSYFPCNLLDVTALVFDYANDYSARITALTSNAQFPEKRPSLHFIYRDKANFSVLKVVFLASYCSEKLTVELLMGNVDIWRALVPELFVIAKHHDHFRLDFGHSVAKGDQLWRPYRDQNLNDIYRRLLYHPCIAATDDPRFWAPMGILLDLRLCLL